jgi:hypothetical protein
MEPNHATKKYPPNEFWRDFEEWQKKEIHPNVKIRAKMICSVHYPDPKTFEYRYNRFACVIKATQRGLPALIQDRIALRGVGRSGSVPGGIFLALHEYYCSLDQAAIRAMPLPDWSIVLDIYDRLSTKGE